LVPDLAQRLGEIAEPTLVLVGEEDQPDMHAIAERLAREIPGARHATIPETAHVPSMERPREFDGLVLPFLEEAASAPTASPGGSGGCTPGAGPGTRGGRGRGGGRSRCGCANGSATWSSSPRTSPRPGRSTRSCCSAWAARAWRRKCCGEPSEPSRSTCSTR